ncbi:integrator complex subunit 4 isoform X2 [Scyliorhinus torazame]|uniref:integrator complex subunit 4 isoform X2 n=1 Tax=Scyliorhinus torazame TaxID=75743 RepID=UPI003B5A6EF8
MAAHLKKRVYEEFTKVVQQQPHEEIPAKKLRLTKPSKSAALHIDLCKSTNSTEALQYLLQFAKKPVEAESVEGVVRILLDHYYKENESSVRLKIASLIGLLSKTSGFAVDCIIDDVIIALNNEKSHHVLAQLLDTILVIGIQLQDNLPLSFRLVEIGCKHLADTSHMVRNKCLQLIGCLGSLDKPVMKELENLAARDVQKIISDSFTDQDPRVRTAAMKAMLQLHERGMKLQQIIYCQACKALSDDYEQVRSVAVQLVWVLSQLYPDSIVPIPSSNEEIRLVDDAFGKVCHMVNDGSWLVRVQAAKLLGSMRQVSVQFLEQTLDKKLMSDLKRKRSAHERAKELYTSGEFSSGRKWGDDAPKEAVDTYTVNLINSGACGAFVHGLEDEMYEVRNAAVESLCMLAQASASFAEKCLDFLVDMFNDEIEEVRLGSIHALRKISCHIRLREDQLDTVLAVLEDSSRDIREALHELVCYTNVSTKDGIHLALVELLKNLAKYPTDRNSIWKCLKYLGSRHPTLVLPLVPELLSTHPYFDTPEPDMDDPAYIAVLVLVFNAAKTCPTMSALFSDHTFRHYAYLRDSLSHLVPALQLPGRKMVTVSDSTKLALSEDSSRHFVQQSLDRVQNIQHLDAQGAQDLLKLTIRDLQRLGELQPELAGIAEFSATYLECQLLLMKSLQEKLWNVAAPLYLKQNAMAAAAAKKILEHTYKLEFLYSGLESRHVAIIHHMRLQAKALQLILTARTTRGYFASELQYLQESFVEKLLEVMPRLLACKPAEVVKILQTTLRHSNFLLLELPAQVHRASATIIEPTGESDNPLRFTSGLVVALDVDATLEHVQEPQTTVKVQIMYPDGQAHIIHPKPADFRNPGPGRHRLITQVYLSHTAWTEPCQIEVRLLLAYSSSWSRASSLSAVCRAAWNDSMDGLPQTDSVIEGTINLSKQVKVYLMPKPARR